MAQPVSLAVHLACSQADVYLHSLHLACSLSRLQLISLAAHLACSPSGFSPSRWQIVSLAACVSLVACVSLAACLACSLSLACRPARLACSLSPCLACSPSFSLPLTCSLSRLQHVSLAATLSRCRLARFCSLEQRQCQAQRSLHPVDGIQAAPPQ